MVAVFPVLLAEHARSAFWVGLAISAEGLLALVVPYWTGVLSDRLPERLAKRFGRRGFFLLLTAPIMALSLLIVPFLDGYWRMAGVGVLFFGALHAYLTPLWALMIDAVPQERWGEAQGVRGVFHSAGLGYGLVVGGLLFAIWRPLPFLLAGLLVLLTTALTWYAQRDPRLRKPHERASRTSSWQELKRDPRARWFLTGNALWTGGVDGLRPYFFLFAVTVIGVTVAQASLLLILLVLGLGAGSLVLGRLGDRYDRAKLLRAGIIVTGVTMIAGVFVRDLWTALPLLLIAGLGAAAVIALPFPVYADLIGANAMGRNTGLYVVSLGAGRMLTPILIGAAIDAGAGIFPDERGYPFMWPIAGLMMLGGAAALTRAMRAHQSQRASA